MSLFAVAELIAHPKNPKPARRNAAQPNSQNAESSDIGNVRPRDCHARASESIVRYSYSHTAQKLKPKPRISPQTVTHDAAITMQAAAARTKFKPKSETQIHPKTVAQAPHLECKR